MQTENLNPATLVPEPTHAASAFAALGLIPELLRAVQSLGYQQPTSVQEQCLQHLNTEPQLDLMVSSQTGSGKTAAFLLPVMQHIWQALQVERLAQAAAWQAQCEAAIVAGLPPPAKPKRRPHKTMTAPGRGRRDGARPAPRALVLCPTRELAQQVSKMAIALVQHLPGLRIAAVTGGASYSVQLAALQNVQLLVATPGRLLDLHNSGALSLGAVQTLVLDEADRMLDLGFAPDVQTISAACEQRRQTLMFSATFSSDIEGLAATLMDQPKRLTLHSATQAHRDIDQVLHWANDDQHQIALLDHYLRDSDLEQAIVFTRTQIECEALAQSLQASGHSACPLHGAQSQGLRNRHMTMVRNGRVRVLVATDVAARGIDVPNISHVFNFGLPQSSEDYTHRIGRTGRAGRSGRAISLLRLSEQRRLSQMINAPMRQLKVQSIVGLEPSHSPHLQAPGGRGGFGGRGPGRSGFGGGYGNAAGGKRSSFGGPRSGGSPARSGADLGDRAAGKFSGYARSPASAKAATHAIFHNHSGPAGPKRDKNFGGDSFAGKPSTNGSRGYGASNSTVRNKAGGLAPRKHGNQRKGAFAGR